MLHHSDYIYYGLHIYSENDVALCRCRIHQVSGAEYNLEQNNILATHLMIHKTQSNELYRMRVVKILQQQFLAHINIVKQS